MDRHCVSDLSKKKGTKIVEKKLLAATTIGCDVHHGQPVLATASLNILQQVLNNYR